TFHRAEAIEPRLCLRLPDTRLEAQAIKLRSAVRQQVISLGHCLDPPLGFRWPAIQLTAHSTTDETTDQMGLTECPPGNVRQGPKGELRARFGIVQSLM